MTRDDIIRLALEAGFDKDANGVYYYCGVSAAESDLTPSLKRFAALVAAAERESIAEMFDRNALYYLAGSEMRIVQTANAAAIRTRGEQEKPR